MSSKRNRPHRVTEESRRFVMAAQVAQAPTNEIAEALGIDAATLRKHYEFELNHGRDFIVIETVARLLTLCEGGDFRALKFMLERGFHWGRKVVATPEPTAAPRLSTEQLERIAAELEVEL